MSKQEAKNVKALQALTRLPGNRQCFNCGSLVRSWTSAAGFPARTFALSPDLPLQGPQYVVSDFAVFVCTTCSGVQCVPTPKLIKLGHPSRDPASLGLPEQLLA